MQPPTLSLTALFIRSADMARSLDYVAEARDELRGVVMPTGQVGSDCTGAGDYIAAVVTPCLEAPFPKPRSKAQRVPG